MNATSKLAWYPTDKCFIGGRWVATANGRPLLAFFDCDDMAIKYGPRS